MATQKKWMTITGWTLVVLITLMLGFSATMKLLAPKEFGDQWVEKFGYPMDLAKTIAIVEIACAIIFLIPRTTVLGAILVVGYLGGAIATHVRVSDSFIPPALVGIFVWLSVYLRDARVRAILPLRKPMS